MGFTSKEHDEHPVKERKESTIIHAECMYSNGDLVGYKWPKEANCSEMDSEKKVPGGFLLHDSHASSPSFAYTKYYGATITTQVEIPTPYFSSLYSQPSFLYVPPAKLLSKGIEKFSDAHGSWHLIGSFFYKLCAYHQCLHPTDYDCNSWDSSAKPWYLEEKMDPNVSKFTFASGEKTLYKKMTKKGPSTVENAVPMEKFHDHLILSPRPRIKDIHKLKKQGVKIVYSLIRPEESPFGLKTACDQAGISWRIAPLDSRNNKMSPVAHFVDHGMTLASILRELSFTTNSKVFVHCAAGIHRTGMVAYVALRRLGFQHEDAMKFLEQARPIIVEQSHGRLEYVADSICKFPMQSIYYKKYGEEKSDKYGGEKGEEASATQD